ncbi:MAG: STAS domain-containing protein [Acidimicrobiales bacterium]
MSGERQVQVTGVRITLSGDLDLPQADDLRRQLAQLSRPGQRVEIDMSRVTFFNSTTVSVIAAAYQHIEAIGGAVVIIYPSVIVRRVLEITGLQNLIDPVLPVAVDPSG